MMRDSKSKTVFQREEWSYKTLEQSRTFRRGNTHVGKLRSVAGTVVSKAAAGSKTPEIGI